MKKILYLMALIPSFAFSGLRSDSALFTTAASTITLETNGVDASTAKVNLYSGTSFFGSYISGPHVRLCDKVGLNCVDLTQSGLSFPTSTLGASFSNIGEINFLDGSQQITAWTGEAPNVAGQILIKHADGTQTSTTTTTDTDNARGQLLMDMWANRLDRDTFILSGSTFNIANSSMDMTLNGVGHVNIQGMGRDSTLLKATDPSVLLNPGTGSVIEDLTVECTSVNDFCLPIGTENRGSTNVTVKNSRIKAPRDLVYTDNQTPVSWNFYDCLFEGGWDGFVQNALSFTSTTTVFNVYNGQVNMVANRSNDDGGDHVHGVLAFNPKGTVKLFNTTFDSSNALVENVGIDVSGGHVKIFGGSITARGALPLHVRNDDQGGTFEYSVDTVFSSTMSSFNNQAVLGSFKSSPMPWRIGNEQAIMTLDDRNGCFRVGDDDSLGDGSYFMWCTDSGLLDVSISGDHPFSVQGSNLHSGNSVYFAQLFMPEANTTQIGQSLNIADSNDAFNAPQIGLQYVGSVYTSLRIHGDGSVLFNPAGGASGTTTSTKRTMAIQISTGGANPSVNTQGQSYTFGGTLYEFFNSTGNTGTTETTLYSNTISSNTLFRSSDSVSFSYFGTAANSATATSQFKVKYGTTTIFDTGAMAMSTAGSWAIQGSFISNSTTTIIAKTTFEGSGFALSASANVVDVGGLNRTGSNTLSVTATRAGVGAATGDLLGRGGKISLWPAP